MTRSWPGWWTSFGLPRPRRPADTHFAALVRSIVYQQLAGAAASTIHRRLAEALGGDVTPEAMLALTPEELRGAGMSGNKAASVCDLAAKVLDGTVVLDPRGLAREGDEEVVERLTTVRGIGRWTAEMFLMFQLRRLDVWPTGDLGVRQAATAWPGRSPCRAPASWSRSATPSGPIVRWWPGTAGGRPSSPVRSRAR